VAECSAWGLYPKVECKKKGFRTIDSLREILQSEDIIPYIPYGNGRSYGDSALSHTIIETQSRDAFIDFDEEEGLLCVEAGVLLADILEHFVPKGWFLKVTPGTKLITVGGALASDVHGKNHHIEGCFSSCVESFDLMLHSGEVVTCTKEETPELWQATCGGMGLTGVILRVNLFLKPISSSTILQTTIKTSNLQETFEAFESYEKSSYSVAWIDCLATGESIGKSLLMVGEFEENGSCHYQRKKEKSIPFMFPSFALNKWSVKAFNWLYYNRIKERVSSQQVDIDTFFYPLDAIGHWNRIYGKSGFTQYQFILPKAESYEGLREILETIAASGKGSFLAVLKLYGPANENWLSFPMEGYSLALDFKIEPGVFTLLDRLDEIVIRYGGRIYLTKDVRVTQETFEKGYPMIDRFRDFRKREGMKGIIDSYQSQRVGI